MLDDGVLPEWSVQSKSSDDDCVMPHRLPLPEAVSNVHRQEKSLSTTVVLGCCVVVVVAVVVVVVVVVAAVVVVAVVVVGRRGADVVATCVCFRPEARDILVIVVETTVKVIARCTV